MRFRGSLADTYLISLIIIAVISIAVVGYLWISQENNRFDRESATIREEYVESKKARIKDEVHKVIDYLRYKRSQTEDRLKDEIKNRVYEAVSIARNLYEENKGKLPLPRIKKMVLDALRPIRYNNGRGYFFATGMNGVDQLAVDNPAQEGQDIRHIMDTQGKPVVDEMIDLITRKGEGYCRYTWAKLDRQGRHFPKVTFIKEFKPFGLFFGTGGYLDDVEEDIKREVLDRIGRIRFERHGYVFAFTFGGTVLSHPGPQYLGGPLHEVVAENGPEKVRQAIAKGRSDAGGYVEYLSRFKPGEDNAAQKISYFKAIPEWGWVVGAGEYTGEIEEVIAQKEVLLKQHIAATVKKIILILLGLVMVVVLISRRISGKTAASFDAFSSFFRKAATESSEIDVAGLDFSEFKTLASAANRMIEAREEAEQEIKKSNLRLQTAQVESARLALALEQVAEIIVITDSEGTIQYVNPSFEKATGYSRQEAVGQNPRILKSGEHQDDHYKTLWETITGGSPWRGRFINKRKDGSIYHEEATISPIRDSSGGIINYVAVKFDVTQELQVEKQLQQSQKMEAIGTLAGGIAHDFNNILGAIVGYTEMALYDTDKDSLPADNLRQVLAAGQRAKELVQQILSFSRMGADKKVPMRLGRIIKESVKLLRASLPSYIEIRQELSAENDYIMGNPTRIHQVLVNLCTNALHAMEEDENGGVLSISLESATVEESDMLIYPDLEPGQYLRLTVSDTGTGMSPEVVERIFDPYFTTKELGKGTGLGLAVAHGVIQKHAGCIGVTSQPGKGTTFEILLPEIQEQSAAGEENEPIHMAQNEESVLMVDDEPMLTNMGKQMLEKLGYRVTIMNDPVAALALFKKNPRDFDLVITDMTMPNLAGDKLAREILQISPDIPIVLCTGYTEQATLKKAAAAGISHFLSKPLSLKSLGKTLHDALEEIEVLE